MGTQQAQGERGTVTLGLFFEDLLDQERDVPEALNSSHIGIFRRVKGSDQLGPLDQSKLPLVVLEPLLPVGIEVVEFLLKFHNLPLLGGYTSEAQVSLIPECTSRAPRVGKRPRHEGFTG